MDDLYRKQAPNFVCFEIKNFKDWSEHPGMGCGKNTSVLYMVSFQVMFGIIFLNLFVAVILNGFDDS